MIKLATFPTLVFGVVVALAGCDGMGTGAAEGAGTEGEAAAIVVTQPTVVDERCESFDNCDAVCGANQACSAACWMYVVDPLAKNRRCEQVTCSSPGLLCEGAGKRLPGKSRPALPELPGDDLPGVRDSALRAGAAK